VTAICPGLVHTNITTSAVHVGTDDAEQQRRRQASHTLYARRDYTPDRAAREILRAARRNTAVAPVTAEARVALVASRLAPGLLRVVARHDVSL
jgi:short-subunit dehydrogenase